MVDGWDGKKGRQQEPWTGGWNGRMGSARGAGEAAETPQLLQGTRGVPAGRVWVRVQWKSPRQQQKAAGLGSQAPPQQLPHAARQTHPPGKGTWLGSRFLTLRHPSRWQGSIPVRQGTNKVPVEWLLSWAMAGENKAGLGSDSEFPHKAAAQPSSSKAEREKEQGAALAPFSPSPILWYLCPSKRNPPAKRAASYTPPVETFFLSPKYQSWFLSDRWDKIPWDKEAIEKILNSNTKPSTGLRSTEYSCWSTQRVSQQGQETQEDTVWETHRGRLERERVAVNLLWTVEIPCQQETSWRYYGKDAPEGV